VVAQPCGFFEKCGSWGHAYIYYASSGLPLLYTSQ
jgi:hypothetical protein